MTKNRNIFLIGPLGAGKSTIGRYLAQQLNMEFFDSDFEIEKRTGADIGWVFDVEGENGFRIREEKIIEELTKKNGIVLATGGGSIQSQKNRNCLSSNGTVVYLKTTIEKQLSRTKRDKKRPFIQQYKGESLYNALKKLAKERNPLYEQISDFIIPTDSQSAKVIVNQIISSIEDI
ncbi:shikimate kinase AroK [bacterium endosymbiont of Pedicinus badii]|uniref:shikimate kinase AroK n=1 Tax=bacterium endosymbiont of Pedicinus badii TaxID=1719126 RepID=UPI0009BA5EE4|nr:shikimate kinase AroK [bacterium endosymbiont of Pedicinus badii]OQM34265.1 shikimate kinase [bacterium endosymbiont of Pedicinus badii]